MRWRLAWGFERSDFLIFVGMLSEPLKSGAMIEGFATEADLQESGSTEMLRKLEALWLLVLWMSWGGGERKFGFCL